MEVPFGELMIEGKPFDTTTTFNVEDNFFVSNNLDVFSFINWLTHLYVELTQRAFLGLVKTVFKFAKAKEHLHQLQLLLKTKIKFASYMLLCSSRPSPVLMSKTPGFSERIPSISFQ